MSTKPSLLIQGARMVDPSREIDIVGDVLVLNGQIAGVGEISAKSAQGAPCLSAANLILCPGFIDLHCHLREPGFEEKETIETGLRAAAAGGFTTVCCMPNTMPPIDSQGTIKYILEKAAAFDSVRVLAVACVSKARKGEELSEMGDLAAAGAVAFSDDGSPVYKSALMRHALEYSRAFGLPVIDHCEDLGLSHGGVMNEGRTSSLLGLRGAPAAAEEAMVARDIALARLTGGKLHLAHISTRGSLDLLRRAKDEGIKVTAEVTPHHLTMTEEWVAGNGGNLESLGLAAYDTNARVNPPLRSRQDADALIAGLKEGIIDAIATDHAPHSIVDKNCEFDKAASGISGLETALASLLGLVREGKLDLHTVIHRLTAGPARVLGSSFTNGGSLKVGDPADITIFDPEREWEVRPETLLSKGKNTPLLGHKMKGKVMATLARGKIVYKDASI